MNDFAVELGTALASIGPLISAGAGAAAALGGVWLTAWLQRGRARREEVADAITDLIRTWGEAYRDIYESKRNPRTVEVESAVACVRLTLAVEKKDAPDIEKIVNAVTNSLQTKGAGARIGAAQDALVGWYLGRYTSSGAFQLFKEVSEKSGAVDGLA